MTSPRRCIHHSSVQVVILCIVAVPLLSTGGAAAPADTANPCVGTMTTHPNQSTTVSIQGAHVVDGEYHKRPALLVSIGPNGEFQWTRNASARGRWWAYDVDPLPNGDLLFVTTEPGLSLVGRLDPTTNSYRWLERFDGAPDDEMNPRVIDAHDIDHIGGTELVIADKGEGHERLLIYNRSQNQVTWEWRFDEYPQHFPASGGGPPEDWTHVNDVDTINISESTAIDASGMWMMASVRNFDQVAFINRSTGAVELTLGSDNDHEILHRQHNPDHLWGPDDNLTVLVADSLNDRVVEYAYATETDTWERVWSVTGLNEPRDADRLPNGNTLVTDRMGHRVLEITPQGEVVWEVYTPYEPYDAERHSAGSHGPTMQEYGVTGDTEITGAAGFTSTEIDRCASSLFGFAPSRVDIIIGDAIDQPIHRGEETNTPLLLTGLVIAVIAVIAVIVARRKS